ncbi:DegV family protein [Mycobacterium sp. ITM-2016-00318]|uniref:DegV family protein n=1 Tax=Mycobacterium sp. ITM-2016-00318 TaxID=2099693 RepID=UPI000CFA65A9|nr:DegV family protein [Mycobacterium sp. ITM-2016-00318]WNG91223.1 DegV family protein [Mycobacterium sp. ITM-2016-00318]
MAVVVVTDSSSRLQAEELQRCLIRQVPLHILLDGKDFRDGVDEIPADVHQRHATTAGATPAELADAYREALKHSDGDGVVAVHISAALSSTYSSAVSTAREFGPAVRVVNSRSAAMGVGFVALAAAQEAASGADLDSVEMAARSAVPRGHAFIVVHRLDNLRRSGRIRRGASLLGSALSLKPLLCLDVDGRLALGQRIRTATKAHVAMIDQVAEVVGDGGAKIAVHHVDNPDAAEDIAKTLTVRLPQIAPPAVTEMGPVLSVHVGAGAVGVCVEVDE